MKEKFCYILLVLMTIYLALMYEESWLQALVGFEMLLALGMYLLSWYFKYSVEVSLRVNIPVAEKDQPIPIEVFIKNKGILPISSLQFWLGYENEWGTVRDMQVFKSSVEPFAEEKIQFDAASSYSGRIKFWLQKVRVKDYLGIFGKTVLQKESLFVNVLPKITEIPVEITQRTRNFPVDGDEFEPDRCGDDPSEIFDIREFREGDRLQRIHWKMTARTDTMMTREYSMPKGYKVLFLLDLYEKEMGKFSPERADAFLTRTASVSMALLQVDCIHYAAWYDVKEERIIRRGIRTEEDLYTMLDKLMDGGLYEKEYDLEGGWQASYPGTHCSSVLYLDMNGRLLCNQEMTGEVLEV